MYGPFCSDVHTLVDLVDDREGCIAEFDERHEVHDRRQGPLPSRLVGRCQLLHLVRRSERDQDLDRPLGIVCGQNEKGIAGQDSPISLAGMAD